MSTSVYAGGGGLTSPQAQYERTQLFLARAKLKASSRTSALLSGFAMIAMVELDIKKDDLPDGLLITFAVCTVILVSVHLLALMISTCLLPHVEVAAGLAMDAAQAAQLLPQHHSGTPGYYHDQQQLQQNPPDEGNLYQPHLHMKVYIEMAWMCSTVFGIMLFLLEISLIVWVQFYPVLHSAAYVSTCVVVPIILLFLFVIFKFYQRVVNSRIKTLHSWLAQSDGFNEDGTISRRDSNDIAVENGIQIV
uniref:Calcium release-activated calcium channel protein 1-like n=1 Tax=Hirondellea gigas TaxID=1518452 RepID=A0A2P2I6M4_9CRUS